MPTVDEMRDEQKARLNRYREAAAKLFPAVSFRHQVTCNETAEKNGVFIEGTVWVPREAIEPADTPYTSRCTEEGFDAWWNEFGRTLDVQLTPYYLAMAAWAASRAHASAVVVTGRTVLSAERVRALLDDADDDGDGKS